MLCLIVVVNKKSENAQNCWNENPLYAYNILFTREDAVYATNFQVYNTISAA